MPETPAPAPYSNSGPPQPAFPVTAAPLAAVWHSRVFLIAVAGFALICLVTTFIGGLGFPGGPLEGLYWLGLLVDLIAVVVAVGAFIVVEFLRRRDPARRDLPVYTRFSIFAIVAVVLSLVAGIAWATTGGVEQLGFLLQGVRARYMYDTGGLFVAGIPWALGAIFGAWGFRPRANAITNALAIAAVVIWAIPAVVTTVHAVVYGLGYSD